VMRWDAGRLLFEWAGDKVNWLLSFASYGSNFVFGALGVNAPPWGLIFAFQVLPTIVFIAAVFAFLYHVGIMQLIIKMAAIIMTKLLGTSGAESLNVAASIFMGQTEAPLTIRPFLPEVTRSELMTIMTSGMAHVSGGIMAAYIAYGIEAKHLLAAVIMTAPATIMLAKIFYPEVDHPATAGKVEVRIEKTAVNVIDAAAAALGHETIDENRNLSHHGLIDVARDLVPAVALGERHHADRQRGPGLDLRQRRVLN